MKKEKALKNFHLAKVKYNRIMKIRQDNAQQQSNLEKSRKKILKDSSLLKTRLHNFIREKSKSRREIANKTMIEKKKAAC